MDTDMAREIKFRAWDGDRMAVPYFFEEDPASQGGYRYYDDWRELEDGRSRSCHLMQFTGLKDKNGVEIYEGDILSIPTSFDVPVAIEFNVLGHICAVTEKGQSSLMIGEIERCETLGNIYENPELLQDK